MVPPHLLSTALNQRHGTVSTLLGGPGPPPSSCTKWGWTDLSFLRIKCSGGLEWTLGRIRYDTEGL